MNIESHGSTGGPAHSNHEEEKEEAPKATTIKTVSCIKLGKHKRKIKTKRHHFSLKGTVPFCV